MAKLLFVALSWRTTYHGVALAKTEVRGILSPQSGRQPVGRGGAAIAAEPLLREKFDQNPERPVRA